MTNPLSSLDKLEITSSIVAAYLGNNQVAVNDVPSLIEKVHAVITSASEGKVEPAAAEPPTPAVPIKKSVTPDYIICLEDGRKFKSLRRHLSAKYDLSPEEYREKWKLSADYPMVAPNYAARRSELAKSIGLGLGGIRTRAVQNRTLRSNEA